MIIDLKKYFLNLIEEEHKKSNSKWKNDSMFYSLKSLSIDQRGRIGEYFIKGVFSEMNVPIEYIDNGHDDYDIIIDNIKVEVKLATLDVNNKFQHEGIKSSKLWDMIAFVDVAPDNLYVTFLNKNKFDFSSEVPKIILNSKEQNIHFRGKDNLEKRATGAGYKVDFKLIDLKESKTIKDVFDFFEKEK